MTPGLIVATHDTDGIQSTATFSPDMAYRYALTRTWDERPPLVVVGLNPSTADHRKSDPTVTRCISRAWALGKGGLVMLNAFGLRSTDPTGLLTVADPNGPDNDALITAGVAGRDVICTWGVMHRSLRWRIKQLAPLLAGGRLLCLARNKDGSPKHPLYCRADAQPIPFSLED